MADALFSFHNSNIYKDDVRLLNPPNYLNDELIAFAFEYFQHVLFGESKSVRFISPQTAFIIMHENDADDLKDTVEGCEIEGKNLVFFPVNDNANITGTGGSHWSLLVFDASDQTFYAFDSASQSNSRVAKKLAVQLAPFLTNEEKKTHPETNFVMAKTPQQDNGYDCGLFALGIAEFLADSLVQSEKKSQVFRTADQAVQDGLMQAVTPKTAHEARGRIKQWIKRVEDESQ